MKTTPSQENAKLQEPHRQATIRMILDVLFQTMLSPTFKG